MLNHRRDFVTTIVTTSDSQLRTKKEQHQMAALLKKTCFFAC
jgi:hypothetical protein